MIGRGRAEEAEEVEQREEEERRKGRRRKRTMESAKKRLAEHLAAQATVVPTAPSAVVALLRELSQPVRLFGESEPARRERLRAFMAQHGVSFSSPLVPRPSSDAVTPAAGPGTGAEKFFYLGAPELAATRQALVPWTLERASKRLASARAIRQESDRPRLERFANRAEALKKTANFVAEVGGTRPLSSCAFSASGRLAVSDWSGAVKVWEEDEKKNGGGSETSALAVVWERSGAHGERVQCVAWTGETEKLLSCGADNVVRLWDTTREGKKTSAQGGGKTSAPLATFAGHTQRVNRVAAHPNGSLCVSTSFDATWRMWDLERQACLSVQEGHKKNTAIYGCAIHADGSLVATCGLDSLIRIWDIRSGCAIAALRGHVKSVMCAVFSPSAYHVLSGSDDNTIRIWDLRKRSNLYTVPAHSNTVTHIACADTDVFLSSSFDKTVKAWSGRDFSSLATLSGHSDKVTGCDVNARGNIASVGFDKTIRLWQPV